MMGEKLRRKRSGSSRPVFSTGAAEFDFRVLHAHESGAFRGFRRDAKDRVVAREAVTGLLLGDPAPGKFNHQPLWDPETGQTTIDRRVTLPRLRFRSGEGLKDHQ